MSKCEVVGCLNFMSRISIDVSPEDHQRLKALAALKDNQDAMDELETLLDDRIEHHNHSGLKGRASAKVILDDALASR